MSQFGFGLKYRTKDRENERFKINLKNYHIVSDVQECYVH